jgi:integrase
METARHSLLDNKVQLYRRANSPHWQCSCTVGSKQRRATTKEESLARAKDVARDWYLGLMGKYRAGDLKEGVTFRKAAEQFLKEYEVITLGERNAGYVKSHGLKLNKHLYPFFGDKVVTDITPGLVQEYRLFRLTPKKDENGNVIMDPVKGLPKRPSRSTLHQEIITLNHVLKTANRHGWLPFLPNISAPYKTSGKIEHRAWFSKQEYKDLYTYTAKRAKNPPHNRGRWKTENEDLHDYILFMTNTGLRPDEAKRLQLRDVTIVKDEGSGEEILEIAVRGKRGTGWCMSMPGAVLPFRRTVDRHARQPKDLIFPRIPRELLNSVLTELDLKFDREGNRRTAYSFRHTYFCFRLMDGADIYQLAKNGRTSVEMLEKYYVVHLKDMIDTAAVNVRKAHPNLEGVEKTEKIQ